MPPTREVSDLHTRAIIAWLTSDSDILAELQLPQSGILQFESHMPYPSVEFARSHNIPSEVAEGYIAQLYLRKQLNKVHNLLYDPEKDTVNPRHLQAMENEVGAIQNYLKYAKRQWVRSSSI
jgi:ribosomal protein S15P/S13E